MAAGHDREIERKKKPGFRRKQVQIDQREKADPILVVPESAKKPELLKWPQNSSKFDHQLIFHFFFCYVSSVFLLFACLVAAPESITTRRHKHTDLGGIWRKRNM